MIGAPPLCLEERMGQPVDLEEPTIVEPVRRKRVNPPSSKDGQDGGPVDMLGGRRTFLPEATPSPLGREDLLYRKKGRRTVDLLGLHRSFNLRTNRSG
jgi:hypothetical protein